MRTSRRALVGSIVLMVTAIGVPWWYLMHYKTRIHAWSKIAPKEDNETFARILEYRKRGDFDDAVASTLKDVNGKPPDDFLLETVADTYFERAQADPTRREQWVNLAVQYSEQALERNPGDVVNVFNVGESYLSAGMNLQKPKGCNYYGKALEVFERLKADPILQNESEIIEGERVPMEPYRKRLDEKIKYTHQLASECPPVAEKP